MQKLKDMWHFWWGTHRGTANEGERDSPQGTAATPNRNLLSISSILVAAIGAVALLALSSSPELAPNQRVISEELVLPAAASNESGELDYRSRLEQQLTSMLSQIQGAGRVQVLVTLSTGPTKEFAEDVSDTQQVTEEVNQQGTTRKITSVQTDRRLVVVRAQDGSETPVLRRETVPQVQGVMVLAEGADRAQVRYRITKAVSTVLGIAEYRVVVVPMGK